MNGALLALWWGGLSAFSLPLGAGLGLWLKPGHKWTSSLMAYGGGALLAALTLELVSSSLEKAGFGPLGTGLVGGALLFMGLNALLNGQGGFLRKSSTTQEYLRREKRKKAEGVLDRLARVGILRALPPEEMQAICPFVQEVAFKAGETVFEQGDEGDKLYLIESGKVEVVHRQGEAEGKVAALGAGSAFGEMALLTGEPRTASIRVLEDLEGWAIAKEDFDLLLKASPGLSRAVTALLAQRLGQQTAQAVEDAARAWADDAKRSLSGASVAPNDVDVNKARQEHGGAPMAIWLGILLDGIPESLVIGASMIHTSAVSLTLIVGVFLANFPEALSASVGMRKGGMSPGKVLWMWTSLMLLTAAGAAVGYLTFHRLSDSAFALVEGLAAGAMLAMIAETMLPEAAEQGGPANGLMTVLGFLSALFVSQLGGPAAH